MNINSIIKQTTAYTLVTVLMGTLIFTSFEPVYLKAQSDNSTITVTLNVDSGITITSPANITLTPNIGIASNSAIGSQTWNVKTNDPDGYTLALKAAASPAMAQAALPNDSFADYQTTAPNTWAVPSGQKQFGFSVYGSNVNTTTWGTGASCGSAGTPLATLKYQGFATTDHTVVTEGNLTTTSGIDTTVCFAAAQNAVYASAGTYTANITATATVQ